jgi:hypothetical protein
MEPMQDQFSLRTVRIDGPEIQQMESQYRERGRIAEEEWDALVATAAQVLSKCPDSQGPNRQVTGLALGKVQSGKTLSYTALIALAIDNGYRIAVVLAGTKNPLLEQSYARLVHDLDAQRLVLTPFRNPTFQDSEVIHSILHSGGNALIVVLKNRRRIDEVTQLLNIPELRGYPVLVIDDEGDEASLNTQFRRGRQSAIYNSILRLRRSLPLHAYVAYTATPQANLLISGVDGLSPDFVELVEPGVGYCGGAIFFGENSDHYLRRINPAYVAQDFASQLTPDLYLAIATFLVGGAIRSLRGDRSFHSMLLHTSNLRLDHDLLQRSIIHLISLWREVSGLPYSDPSSEDLFRLMHRAYDDLCTTSGTPPSWESVREILRDEVWLCEVWMVNSLPLGRDPVAMPFRLKNNIFVGGNMLGRGVTIPGLAVTYITREAQQDTNADTLEQRARWFGYKQNYLDVCRIFLTERLMARYTELLQHEDDFWEALRRNQRQGISVREWPRMFRLDMETWKLRPTRPQVAAYREFRSQGWDIQRRVILNPNIASQNVQAAKRFFERHHGELRRFGNVEHLVIPGISPEVMISDLLSKMELEESDWEKSYVEEYLTRLNIGGRLQAMDVLLMSNGQFRERKASDDGRINPMQGRSPHREPGDPDYYPGDEYIHNEQIHLQVHLVGVRESDTHPPVETTALALYIPNDPRYDLRAVVRGNDY